MNDPGNNQRKGDLVTRATSNPRSVARHGARHPKSPLKRAGPCLGQGVCDVQPS
jgi:hypothetical protein